MTILIENIVNLLKTKNISKYSFAKSINYSRSALSMAINGKTKFSKNTIKKIALFFELSEDEVLSWVIAEDYSKTVIELAIKIKELPKVRVKIPQSKQKRSKILILTSEIDKRILAKGLSRTRLSTMIDCHEGTFNPMVIGKRHMSDEVISKISPILEASENEILSWRLADEYSIEALNLALKK